MATRACAHAHRASPKLKSRCFMPSLRGLRRGCAGCSIAATMPHNRPQQPRGAFCGECRYPSRREAENAPAGICGAMEHCGGFPYALGEAPCLASISALIRHGVTVLRQGLLPAVSGCYSPLRFKSSELSAMNWRMASAIDSNLSHCSRYRVTGNLPIP